MNQQSPRRVRPRAARVVGGGVIAVAMLALVAVAAEAWFRYGPPCRLSVMVHDSSVGWRLKAGVDGSVLYDWSTDSVDFRFNAAGFRDRDHATIKPAGVTRIVVLGDSYTAGLEVPSEEIFTARLERRLRRGPGALSRAEVMNVAVGAWSTDQQLIELRERSLSYDPDFVVVMIAPNDVREAYAKGFFRLAGDTLRERRGDPVPLAARVAWASSNRSCAFQALQAGLGSRHGTAAKMFDFYPVHFPIGAGRSSDEAIFLRERPPELAEAYRLFDALVMEIVDGCRSIGCRPLLAVVPTKIEFDGTLDSDVHEPGTVAAHVRALSERHGIDYLDLFGPLESSEDPLRLFIEEEYHFTSEGHAYVAERLGAWFESLER